jgi:chemotaxis protein MotB
MPTLNKKASMANQTSRRRRHQRSRHEDQDSSDRWLVSYADFITLLFAFFTVLYATAQQDVKKQEQFQDSARKYFSGGIGFGSAGDISADSNSNVFIQPVFQTFPPPGSSAREVQSYIQHELQTNLTPDEYKATVESVRSDAAGVRMQLASATLFAPGSSSLREEALAPLDKIAVLLKASKRRVVVEGHTDDVPIHTEQFPSNWELSSARATKIVRYLVQRHGIDPSRLIPVGYADTKPLVPNKDAASRAKNRRIELMMVTDEKKVAL